MNIEKLVYAVKNSNENRDLLIDVSVKNKTDYKIVIWQDSYLCYSSAFPCILGLDYLRCTVKTLKEVYKSFGYNTFVAIEIDALTVNGDNITDEALDDFSEVDFNKTPKYHSGLWDIERIGRIVFNPFDPEILKP